MGIKDRGFASMDHERRREIASAGGRAAQKGTAHEWTPEEARAAGRKGGLRSRQRQRRQSDSDSEPVVEDTAFGLLVDVAGKKTILPIE